MGLGEILVCSCIFTETISTTTSRIEQLHLKTCCALSWQSHDYSRMMQSKRTVGGENKTAWKVKLPTINLFRMFEIKMFHCPFSRSETDWYSSMIDVTDRESRSSSLDLRLLLADIWLQKRTNWDSGNQRMPCVHLYRDLSQPQHPVYLMSNFNVKMPIILLSLSCCCFLQSPWCRFNFILIYTLYLLCFCSMKEKAVL